MRSVRVGVRCAASSPVTPPDALATAAVCSANSASTRDVAPPLLLHAATCGHDCRSSLSGLLCHQPSIGAIRPPRHTAYDGHGRQVDGIPTGLNEWKPSTHLQPVPSGDCSLFGTHTHCSAASLYSCVRRATDEVSGGGSDGGSVLAEFGCGDADDGDRRGFTLS